jgi:hypothetical protein
VVIKKPNTAYFIFLGEMRAKNKAAEDGNALKSKDLFKVVSQQWASLTPEEKSKYNDLATADKERYRLEVEKYGLPEDTKKNGSTQSEAALPLGASPFSLRPPSLRPPSIALYCRHRTLC